MQRCNGRLFDGSACNNLLLECEQCRVAGCQGDGCDSQRFVAADCDCGAPLVAPLLVGASAA